MNASPPDGAIVLGAYKPDPELLARQLRSIREQTVTDWVCLVGADGDLEVVQSLVRSSVESDPRFVVVGWEHRAGMYLNYERLLAAVPLGVRWVAPSDHDDLWFPDKLERLVGALEGCDLVAAQATVVRWPGLTVLAERTDRRWVPLQDLILQNQVSGGVCVFRRELLDLALPFPRYPAVTQVPDHWLALCAAASGGYRVLDDVVQEYVQHAANTIGEQPSVSAWVRTGWAHLAPSRVGGARQATRTLRRITVGWRGAAVEALLDRGATGTAGLPASWRRTRRRRSIAMATRAVTSDAVLPRVALPIVAGAALDTLSRSGASTPEDDIAGVPLN